ncbi:hypothetical protein C5E07_05820 [Pseudoclavibacter sp. RFBJ3]|nr:hypothetical protein C5B99_08490 [Pseudoclavibacter sp. Z016]PPF85009.1 hypothetical protein C5C12_06530 [Pseudoclavibacter sp. RFBJ5]PPF94012.1 hypothetical protein C5E07_05820 [Pseudoclavibacter sp. RFBJ3]PPF98729.1 hypothetical protein C5C19_08805 [Pseudoclavibacter sp. RFBH5]PPG02796.1 hypothetical protein C5E06_10120 [Pseudoclavibacter sp. RFBI5]PPG24310.1 hypothetical protein C5E13_06065 [Pseudoclavibacter sp. RFBI4]
MTGTALLARIRSAFAGADDTKCRASVDAGTRTCGKQTDPVAARSAGHAGFCSHECAIEDLDNSPM